MNHLLSQLTRALCTLFVVGTMAACGGDTHQHDGSEDHEHGDATHMHQDTAADTAGTYVDSTGAFFDAHADSLHDGHGEEGAHQQDPEDHEHGEDGHTH